MSVQVTEFDGINVNTVCRFRAPGVFERNALFLGNTMILANDKFYAYHLLDDHVPQALQDEGVSDTSLSHTVAGWIDYAVRNGLARTASDVFPEIYREDDFRREDFYDVLTDDVGLLKTQVAELEQTFSTDAERVVAITNLQNQIDARASIDGGLDTRIVALEADPTTATALSSEASARQSADTVLSDRLDVLEADPTTATAISGEASARQSADTVLSGRLDILEADPTTATALSSETGARQSADTVLSGRLDILEADPTTAAAVASVQTNLNAEQASRIAADNVLTAAVNTEKARIDGILHLSADHLDTFKEIEEAYKAADSNAHSALNNLILAACPRTDFDTRSAAVDASLAARQTTADQEATYRKIADSYQKSEVDAFVAARQTTADQEATYRKIADSYQKSEVDAFVAARQTTVDQEATYRKIADSYQKSEVDAFVAARQTTVDQEATYRKIADSYTKTQVDGYISALQTDVDNNEAAIAAKASSATTYNKSEVDAFVAARQTTVDQEATYRKIADSYTKTQVDGYLASKQGTLTSGQQAVVDANAYTTAEKAKVAYYDETSNLSTLLGAKQNTLTSGQQAVVDANAYTTAEKAKVAYYDQTSNLSTLLAAKQNSLTSGQQAVVDANAYTTAEKAKVAYYDETSNLSTLLGAKQNTLTSGQQAVVDANAYTTAEKAKVAYYDETSNLSTLLAAKQDALTDTSGFNLTGGNAAIGKAAVAGGTRLAVKGHLFLEDSGSTRGLRIHDGRVVEANHAISDAIDLRCHGLGRVRFSNYANSSVTEVASIGTASAKFACPVLLTSLPTSDPGVAGQLWRNGSDLKISI